MTLFEHDRREALVAACVAYYSGYHTGIDSWYYGALCRAKRLAERMGVPELEAYELNDYSALAAEYYVELGGSPRDLYLVDGRLCDV